MRGWEGGSLSEGFFRLRFGGLTFLEGLCVFVLFRFFFLRGGRLGLVTLIVHYNCTLQLYPIHLQDIHEPFAEDGQTQSIHDTMGR